MYITSTNKFHAAMAKKYKVVDPFDTGTSKRVLVTDWSKCAFCQEDSSEVLHCPAESRRNTSGAGYKTISDLLVGFSTIGCLPRTMDLSHLDVVRELRQQCSSTKPNGMIRVDFSITKPNYSLWRKGRDPQKTCQMPLQSLHAKVRERQVFPFKHASFLSNLHHLEDP